MAIVDSLLLIITLVAALGCGLMAGLFFAFSVSVMSALARIGRGRCVSVLIGRQHGIPTRHGGKAMETIEERKLKKRLADVDFRSR